MKSFLNHRSHFIIIPFLYIFLISCNKKEDAKVDSTSKTEFVLNEDSLSSPVYVAKYVVFKEQIEKYDEDEGDLNFDHIELKDGITATNITNYFPPAEMFYLWKMKNGKIDPLFSIHNHGYDKTDNFYEKDFNKDGLPDLVATGYSSAAKSYTDVFLQKKPINGRPTYERLTIFENEPPLFLDINNDSVVDIIDPNWRDIFFPINLTTYNEQIEADWKLLLDYQNEHNFLPELKNTLSNGSTPLLAFYPIKIYTINMNHQYIQDVTFRYPEILKMHLKCLLSTRFKQGGKSGKEIKIHTKYMIHNINSRLEYATDTNFLPIFEKELEEKKQLELDSYEPF